MKNFDIHIRRRGKDYNLTAWGGDDKEVCINRCVAIMQAINMDRSGPNPYQGMLRFTGIKLIDKDGNLVYHQEQP